MVREMTNGGQRASGLEVERARITGYYGRRAAAGLEHRYSLFNPGQLYLVQHLERDLLAALRRHGFAHFAGRSILDVGCGDGTLTRRIVDAGALVIGLDASPEMVEAARARGVDAFVADAQALDLQGQATRFGQFDAAFSNAALHWMLDPEAVAAGLFAMLKPGGRFVGELGGFGNI